MDCAARLRRLIDTAGPIPIATFMAEANGAYYAARDPLGRAGDFVTAPEISQMFGEMIALWLTDLVKRAGAPPFAYVEAGPGRGTLAADILRTATRFGLHPPVHLIETSPVLRAMQAQRFPDAHWHDDSDTLPDDRPLVVIANEFFDALPIRQLVRTAQGWRERQVAHDGTRFLPVVGPTAMDSAVPEALRDAPEGTILESAPAASATMALLADRVKAQGGAILVIDYGYARAGHGDTLQAVRAHAYADPFADPGLQDLTAHVDFGALADAARDIGLNIAGPIDQGLFLHALGLETRAAALAAARPDHAADITAQRDRLCGTDAMGSLFKVLAATSPDWPHPEGFSS